MSDLFCAATLVLARHGETSYLESWFSDEGGWLSADGRAQARALAERLAGRRIARIWASDTSRAVQTAEIVAAELGLSGGNAVITHKALREVYVGSLDGEPFDVRTLHAVTDRWFDGDLASRFPDGESGHEVVSRYGQQLDAIADESRGETVLVVVHQTATAITLASRASNVSPSYARDHQLANGESLELALDADGWQLMR